MSFKIVNPNKNHESSIKLVRDNIQSISTNSPSRFDKINCNITLHFLYCDKIQEEVQEYIDEINKSDNVCNQENIAKEAAIEAADVIETLLGSYAQRFNCSREQAKDFILTEMDHKYQQRGGFTNLIFKL